MFVQKTKPIRKDVSEMVVRTLSISKEDYAIIGLLTIKTYIYKNFR